MLASADILGTQRRHGGQHGAGHEEQKADDLFHDAHSGRIGQAAMICNDGDDHEGHLDEAILQHHRHTDAKQLAQHILLRSEVCTRHADAVPLPNDQQRHYHADQLGKGRA